MKISKKSWHYRFVHWSFGDFEIEESLVLYVLAFLFGIWCLPARISLIGVKDRDAQIIVSSMMMTVGFVAVFLGVAVVLLASSSGLPNGWLALQITPLVVAGIVILGRGIIAGIDAISRIRVRFE